MAIPSFLVVRKHAPPITIAHPGSRSDGRTADNRYAICWISGAGAAFAGQSDKNAAQRKDFLCGGAANACAGVTICCTGADFRCRRQHIHCRGARFAGTGRHFSVCGCSNLGGGEHFPGPGRTLYSAGGTILRQVETFMALAKRLILPVGTIRRQAADSRRRDMLSADGRHFHTAGVHARRLD